MDSTIRSLAVVAVAYGGVGGGVVVGAVVFAGPNVALVGTGLLGAAGLVVGLTGEIDAPGAGAPETEVSAMAGLHGDGGPLSGIGVGGSTLAAALGGGTLLWSLVAIVLTV